MRPDRNRTRSQSGMSLVEVMVSLTILLIVGLATAQLMAKSMQINQLAQQRSMATGMAAERIQQLSSQRFQPASTYTNYLLPGEVAAAGPPQTLTATYGSIPGYPQFRRVVTLTYNVPATGMLRVHVAVIWRNVIEGQKTHEMVTYLDPQLTP